MRNAPSVRAFTLAGFQLITEIALPDKTAALMVKAHRTVELPQRVTDHRAATRDRTTGAPTTSHS